MNPEPGTADYYDQHPISVRAGDVLRYEPTEAVIEHLRRRGLVLEPSPFNPNHRVIRYARSAT